MIIIPTTSKLKEALEEEYENLHRMVPGCSVLQLEKVMRRIHLLTSKIKNINDYAKKKKASNE